MPAWRSVGDGSPHQPAPDVMIRFGLPKGIEADWRVVVKQCIGAEGIVTARGVGVERTQSDNVTHHRAAGARQPLVKRLHRRSVYMRWLPAVL